VFKRKLQPVVTLLTVIAIFLTSLAFFTSAVSGGASIAMANYYPDDGETYESIDHFLDQTTAVNTNTTVSVSIDGGTLIPMAYKGVKNEIVSGDTVTRDWYTWQVTVPTMTAPGRHTFQFFRHYYVWQAVDQYWADFNSYSTVQSFNIVDPSATPSQSPTPATTNPIYLFTTVTASAVAFFVLVAFVMRSRAPQRSQKE
jgi:hypothetical protein